MRYETMKCDGVNVCELFLLLYLPWYCCCCCWRCFGRCCAASATGGTLLDSMVCVYFVVFTTTCCFTTDKLYEIVNVSHYFSSSKTKKKTICTSPSRPNEYRIWPSNFLHEIELTLHQLDFYCLWSVVGRLGWVCCQQWNSKHWLRSLLK